MTLDEICELLNTDDIWIVIGDKHDIFQGSNAAGRAAEIYGNRYVAAITPMGITAPNALEIRLG